MSTLKLHTDGGSRGNPGPAAYGFVVYDISGLPDEALQRHSVASGEVWAQSGAGKVLEKCGNYLGVTTNNQAEYKGLIAGLTWILQHMPASDVHIYMDSLLIVSQVKGEYKVKHPDILPLYQQVNLLLRKLPKYSISYVPRAQNSLADSLVNQALDSHLI